MLKEINFHKPNPKINMKIIQKLVIFISILFIFNISNLSQASYYENNFQEIIIPSIEFTDATLPDICNYLTKKSNELYPNINIVVTYDESMRDRVNSTVTCSFKEIPILAAVEIFAELLDARFSLQKNKIIFHQ